MPRCRDATHLGLPDKDAVVLLAGEVPPALHRAVVLALGLVQDDPDPFAGGEQGGPHVGHGAAVALADDLHAGAHLEGLAAALRAHPARAGGLATGEREAQEGGVDTRGGYRDGSSPSRPARLLQQFLFWVIPSAPQ